MPLNANELAQVERYNEAYLQGRSAPMRDVNRCVCGCDYGVTSWTTLTEADRIAGILGLSKGSTVLDLGSGAGWPAVYFAKAYGCDAVMVDLPPDGLRIALERAEEEGVAGQCRTLVADAEALPLPEAEFSMIHHADLLCCLIRKRAALAECRRVARVGARMVFTVISVATGLSGGAYSRAAFLGPEFIETEVGYASLLDETGWGVEAVHDLTADFLAATSRKLETYGQQQAALTAILGAPEVARSKSMYQARIQVLSDRQLLREMFVVRAV